MDLINKDGKVIVNSLTIQDKIWIRITIYQPRTHLENIKELMEILKQKVDFLKALEVKVAAPAVTDTGVLGTDSRPEASTYATRYW